MAHMNDTQIDPVDYEGLLENQAKLQYLNKQVRDIRGELKRSREYLANFQDADYIRNIPADNVSYNLTRLAAEVAKQEAELAKVLPKVAALEAKRPEINRYTEILQGLKGNIVEKVTNAIEIVIASEEYGTWIPGGSRKVNGLVEKRTSIRNGELQVPKNWVAFKAAVAALNEKRNKAVFITDPTKVSPTVKKTLEGLKLNSLTIRVCPIDYREVTLDNGRKVFHAFLVWPKGTVHGASRFHATNNNLQCQACGHAIKNPFNWVPILVDNAAGVPHSIWVGRDCSKNLFGVELVGALILAEGQR
jgi:hypothetical protein